MTANTLTADPVIEITADNADLVTARARANLAAAKETLVGAAIARAYGNPGTLVAAVQNALHECGDPAANLVRDKDSAYYHAFRLGDEAKAARQTYQRLQNQ